MLKFTSVLILAAVFMQTFSSQLLLTGFILNRDFISANLCEKRNNDNNRCHGKCHLKKELSKDQEEQNSNKSNVKKGIEILFSFVDSETVVPVNRNASEVITGYLDIPAFSYYVKDIFHPPTV